MTLRPAALLSSLALVAGGLTLLAAPDFADAAGNGGTVFIDDALQSGPLGTSWTVAGTGWTPQLTTIAQNNLIDHATNTADCVGWPKCTATYDPTRDGNWLTLTSDNSRNGAGEAGFVLNSTAFSSSRGVVIEYDQRVYRTNNGNMGGILQGGGDGISLFLVDANAPDYGRPTEVETSSTLPGGYGAALGYSSVSNTGASWCPAQPGLAGAYLGVGFDVYGNFQKAENSPSFGANRATRPASVSGNHPSALDNRLMQSIGLRGSGVRFKNATSCVQNTQADLDRSYGMIRVPVTTRPGYLSAFQVRWNAGDDPATYAWEYKKTADSTWTSVPTELVTAGTVNGFDDPRGYAVARIPVDNAYTGTYDVRYRRTTGGDQNFRTISVPRNAFLGTWPDVSFTGVTTFDTVTARKGGYRWLAGTGAHGNTTTGAWIDNTKNDAHEYRRVRVTLTPRTDGSRNVSVSWTPKLSMSADVCVDPVTKVPNGLLGAACTGAAGEWRTSATPTFTEQFSYDLSDSQYQAPMPKQFKFGFAASTGWAVNFHQIRNLRVTSPTDLAVTKKIALGTATDSTTWADTVTGQAGDTVSYRLVATNEGPTPLDKAYPATLTDLMDDVPFADLQAVTWTATATGGAGVRAPSNDATSDDWPITVSGEGPLTGANALEWHSPDRTTAPDAAVTVVVTGTVATNAAPGTYRNTANVTVSAAGGPQETDLSNNDDDALLVLRAGDTWRVEKTATPASGTTVTAGTEITYSVTATADGAEGRGDVRGIVLTDDLSDVLDDATFVPGSATLTIGDGTPLAVADPVGTTLTTAPFDLPHGATATLRYRVTVNADVAGGTTLRNVVVGDATSGKPETCAPPANPDDATCATVHTTPAWSLAKTVADAAAEPGTTLPDGSLVQPGTTLVYSVTATNAGPAAVEAILVDDLSDLLEDPTGPAGPKATFVNGSVTLDVDGNPASGTLPTGPDATTHLLEVGPVTLPAASTAGGTTTPTTAVLTYRVTVADDAWATTLRNAVTGTGTDPVGGGELPPLTCTPDDPCTTDQRTPLLLQVEKQGENINERFVPMDGSQWAIYSDADLTIPVVDPVDAVTGRTGLFRTQLEEPGTYWLVETKALPGFQLLPTPVELTVATDGTVTLAADPTSYLFVRDDRADDHAWTVVVRDVPALDLPESGGERPTGLLVAGTLLTALACAVALRARRRSAAGRS